MNMTYRLRLRVLLAMMVFVLLATGAGLYQLRALSASGQSYALLGALDQLVQYGAGLPESAAHYVENAPRDYESYNRDVRVFLRELNAGLDRFNRRLGDIEQRFSLHAGFALPTALQSLFGGDVHLEQTRRTLEELRSEWQRFRAGYHDKLGDEDPRIEWAAEYIVTQGPVLNQAVTAMVEHYRRFLDQQRALTGTVSRTALVALVLAGVLGLLGMHFRVFRRIGQTVAGCRHVANGEFGYTVPVSGARDELNTLARAFNTLSVRSQLVLNMLTQLQLAEDVEQALTVVVNASGSSLPVAWAGFVAVNEGGERMALTNAIPARSIANWTAREPDPQSGFGRELSHSLLSDEPLLLASLREQVVNEAVDPFLRELVRAARIEALLALPLNSPHGWQGVLLFGSRSTRYTPQQVELLRNLSPAIAISFGRILG